MTVGLGTDVGGVLDSIDFPILVVGRDSTLAHFNRAATDALDVSASDTGLRVGAVPALAGMPDLESICQQVMRDGVASRRDVRVGDRWFLVHVSPATAEQQVTSAVVSFTNVTAFRASMAQAVYDREHTKAILNGIIDPLVVLDGELRIQTANRAFHEWFGVSRERTHGVPVAQFLGEIGSAPVLRASLLATLADDFEFAAFEVDRDYPGVGRRTVLLDARRLVRDGKALILLVLRDITERKATEEAVRQADSRFRTLFESMKEGYCLGEVIFDDRNKPSDFRFLEVNPVFEQQTGIANAKGRLMRQIAPDHEQQWFDIYGRVALTGETVRFERSAAALGRHYDMCAFRVGPPEQRRVGIVFSDITARKSLEQQRELLLAKEEAARKAAEAAAQAKDRFLAMLSHELRTPLSPIVMAVAMMEERRAELPAGLRKHVAIIRRNIDLETRLIDDLLDLNRVTNGKMRLQLEPTHVHATLAHAIQTCEADAGAKGLSVRCDMRAEHDLVRADAARLQQVFVNLLRNAVKFTPKGGAIFVRTESAQDKVRIEIRDTGVGIAPEVLPRIFVAFEQGDMKTTGHFGGLGLGLAICKAIVEIHAGAIRAESAGMGAGATFTVELPTSSEPVDSCASRAEPPVSREGVSILLVEDHPDTREMLAKILRTSSYAVTTATSVESALRLAATERFDVVLSDLGLPDGTGYELMRELRERHGIKGVALSGYGMEEDQRRSREAGFLEHFVKPVDMRQLTAVIERIAGRARD